MRLARKELFCENHCYPAAETQRARLIAFFHVNFEETARSQISEELAVISLCKRLDKPAYRLGSRLQFDSAILENAFRQIFLPEIRDQISKSVSAQDNSFHGSVGLLGAGKCKAFVVGDLISHAGGLPALGKPRSHGCENIPAVKRLAHGLKIIMFYIRVPNDQTFWLALVNHRQHAIVRRDKILICRANQQRPPLRAYPGIHHY